MTKEEQRIFWEEAFRKLRETSGEEFQEFTKDFFKDEEDKQYIIDRLKKERYHLRVDCASLRNRCNCLEKMLSDKEKSIKKSSDIIILNKYQCTIEIPIGYYSQPKRVYTELKIKKEAVSGWFQDVGKDSSIICNGHFIQVKETIKELEEILL